MVQDLLLSNTDSKPPISASASPTHPILISSILQVRKPDGHGELLSNWIKAT